VAGTLAEGRDKTAARCLEFTGGNSQIGQSAICSRGIASLRDAWMALSRKRAASRRSSIFIDLEKSEGRVFPAERTNEIAALWIERAQPLVVELLAASGEGECQLGVQNNLE